MPVNNKIIQRAMAKSIVHDTGDLIILVQKYRPITKNISYAGLLSEVQDLLATSNDFANDYVAFLLKKGRIIDYNNTEGKEDSESDSGKEDSESDSNGGGGGFFSNMLSGGTIGSVSSLFTSIISSGSAKKDRQLEQQKLASQNTAQIMNFMMQEEQTRQAEKNREANMIYIAIGAMVLITGIIIFTRKN
jgi:hypothetical protein